MTDLDLERLVADQKSLAAQAVTLLRVLRALCEIAGVDFEAACVKSKTKARAKP